jgi:GH24 family phage-related lysozyme (muramidase)
MRKFLILSFLLFCKLAVAPILSQNLQSDTLFTRLYEICISDLKHQEGYISTPYICLGGNKTIGYGHCFLPNETFKKITIGQADSILRCDFNKAIYLARVEFSYLPDSQLLAISHFIFSLGIGTFQRSGIYPLIKAGKPIDDEILKYCRVPKKGKDGKIMRDSAGNKIMVAVPYIRKNREFELSLYGRKK